MCVALVCLLSGPKRVFAQFRKANKRSEKAHFVSTLVPFRALTASGFPGAIRGGSSESRAVDEEKVDVALCCGVGDAGPSILRKTGFTHPPSTGASLHA